MGGFPVLDLVHQAFPDGDTGKCTVIMQPIPFDNAIADVSLMRETSSLCGLDNFSADILREALDLETPGYEMELCPNPRVTHNGFNSFMTDKESIPCLKQHLIFEWSANNDVRDVQGQTMLISNTADLGFTRAMIEIADIQANAGRKHKLQYQMLKDDATGVPNSIIVKFPVRRQLQRKEFRNVTFQGDVKLTVDSHTNEESYSIVPPFEFQCSTNCPLHKNKKTRCAHCVSHSVYLGVYGVQYRYITTI